NHNIDEQMTPSSMSKLMTIYVLLSKIGYGVINLDDKVQISRKAWERKGSSMFLKIGQKVKYDDLLNGIVIVSGNDAAISVAEGISGTEDDFIEELNKSAKSLGLTHSHFKNSTGWPDDEHYMSVHDLLRLSLAIFDEFPDYWPRFAIKDLSFNGIKHNNTNDLLFKNLGVDGMKTGHTETGGYGLVASVINDNGRRLFIIVNGLKTNAQRVSEIIRLIKYGYNNYINELFYTKNQIITEIKTQDGAEDFLNLKTNDDIIVSRLIEDKLVTDSVKSLTLQKVVAPIEKNQYVADWTIYNKHGEAIKQIPLYANEDLPRVKFFQLLIKKIKSIFTFQ
ncbi:MAG: D-alanyl-D-alanine carboxypeptidase, partial [Anaplasmataceae bacterium]|nr:D-alanyl-D-alanine carboxypeptidase [Anaplasmataceae bacterium]